MLRPGVLILRPGALTLGMLTLGLGGLILGMLTLIPGVLTLSVGALILRPGVLTLSTGVLTLRTLALRLGGLTLGILTLSPGVLMLSLGVLTLSEGALMLDSELIPSNDIDDNVGERLGWVLRALIEDAGMVCEANKLLTLAIRLPRGSVARLLGSEIAGILLEAGAREGVVMLTGGAVMAATDGRAVIIVGDISDEVSALSRLRLAVATLNDDIDGDKMLPLGSLDRLMLAEEIPMEDTDGDSILSVDTAGRLSCVERTPTAEIEVNLIDEIVDGNVTSVDGETTTGVEMLGTETLNE